MHRLIEAIIILIGAALALYIGWLAPFFALAIFFFACGLRLFSFTKSPALNAPFVLSLAVLLFTGLLVLVFASGLVGGASASAAESLDPRAGAAAGPPSFPWAAALALLALTGGFFLLVSYLVGRTTYGVHEAYRGRLGQSTLGAAKDLLGVNKGVWVINKDGASQVLGSQAKELELTGGPGTLIIPDGYAAILETQGTRRRVARPGMTPLGAYERVAMIVPTGPRSEHVEIRHLMTADHIPIESFDLLVFHRLRKAGDPAPPAPAADASQEATTPTATTANPPQETALPSPPVTGAQADGVSAADAGADSGSGSNGSGTEQTETQPPAPNGATTGPTQISAEGPSAAGDATGATNDAKSVSTRARGAWDGFKSRVAAPTSTPSGPEPSDDFLLKTVWNPTGRDWGSAVRSISANATRDVVGCFPLDELLPLSDCNRTRFKKLLLERINATTALLGVVVTTLDFGEILLPSEVLEKLTARKLAHWKAEIAETELLEAQAHAQAEAYRLGTIEKARATAQRDMMAAIAQGFKDLGDGDPADLLRLRLIEALEKMAEGPATTVVLPAEMLQFLEKHRPTQSPPTPDEPPPTD